MNLERRLQHAAREIREIPVVVPPPSGNGRGGRPHGGWLGARLLAMGAPAVVVVGLFAGVSLLVLQDGGVDRAPAAATADAPLVVPGTGDDQAIQSVASPALPSGPDERVLIDALGRVAVAGQISEWPDLPRNAR